MKTKITGLFAGFILGSFSYNFNLEYEKIKILNLSSFEACALLMTVGAFIIAFLICVFSKGKASKVLLLVYAGIILSVFIRIIYDINFSTITHNLLGIEIIIYTVLTLPSALIGAVLGNSIACRNKKK